MANLLSWLGNTVKGAENAVGNFVHGAGQAIGGAANAVGQAVNNEVHQAPQQIQRVAQQINQNPIARYNPINPVAPINAINDLSHLQLPKIQAPQIQAPHLTLPSIVSSVIPGANALRDVQAQNNRTLAQPQVQQAINSNPVLKNGFNTLIGAGNFASRAANDVGNAAHTVAKFAAPNLTDAVAHPTHIIRTPEVQAVMHGTASPAQFGKAFVKFGAPIGLDAANLLTGADLAGQGLKEAAPTLLKGIAAFTGAQSGVKLAQGQKPIDVVKNLPAEAASNAAAQLLGFGASKLLGRGVEAAGSSLNKDTSAIAEGVNNAASGNVKPPTIPLVNDPNTGKLIKQFAPKADLNAARPNLPGGSIPQDVPRPIVPPATVENKFSQTVKNSPEVSTAVQDAVSGQHDVRNTQALVDSVNAEIKKQGLAKATETTLPQLAGKTGNASDSTIAKAIQLAKQHDALGTDMGHETATNLYNQVAEHLTAKGQGIQVASILASRTPEGQRYQATRFLTKAGVEITPKLQQGISDAVTALKNTSESTQPYYEAQQKLAKLVNSNLPSSNVDKVFRLWRDNLLTGPQTYAKVALSHGIQNTLEAASSPATSALDSLVSHFSGFRSTATTPRGVVGGAIRGGAAAAKLLGTGMDTLDTGGIKGLTTELGRPQARFQSKALSWLNPYMDKVEQSHAALPKVFATSAFQNDLNKQAIAAAKNQGISGAARSAFIRDFVSNPSAAAHAEATHAAQMATFQQETYLGGVAQKLRDVPGGKVLAPFAHIASAILTDAANYSPAGFLKTPIEAIKENGAKGWTPEVQKHFVEGLGRAVTGTGILGAGYALHKAGLMTLDYPKDPKQAALWKAEGRQPGSILIGGKWRQLASLGPAAITLAMGGYASAAGEVGGKGNAALAALTGALKTLSNESFLSGVTGAAGAINNPELSAKSFLKNEVSSLVPTGVGTVAKAFDPLERQTNNITDALKAKIPGIREGLTPQQDSFGNTLPRQGGVVTNLLDPTRPSNAVSNPMINELNRLDTSHNVVDPTPVKDISVGKTSVKLTPQQTFDRNQVVGPQIAQAYQAVMKEPGYAALSDTNKAAALAKAAADINAVGNVKTLVKIDPTKAQTAYNGLDGNQKAMYNGQPTVKDYTALDSNGKALNTAKVSPKDAYQQALDKYNQQKAAGQISSIQDISQQKALKALQVKSNFDQNTVDLYGLPYKDIISFVNSDPNGKALWAQVQALDKATVDAGGTSKLYNKNGSLKTTAAKVAKAKAAKVPKLPKLVAIKSPKFSVKAIRAPKAPKSASVATFRPPKIKLNRVIA